MNADEIVKFVERLRHAVMWWDSDGLWKDSYTKSAVLIESQQKEIDELRKNPVYLSFCFCPRCGEQMNPKNDASAAMQETKPKDVK